MDNSTTVFVYGSLKSGFGNHSCLAKGSKFLGKAITLEDKFNMTSYGVFPAVVAESDNKSHRIFGEVYSVDNPCLTRLDRLESNGTFYNREVIKVILVTGEIVDAWIYLLLGDSPTSTFGVKYYKNMSNVLTWF